MSTKRGKVSLDKYTEPVDRNRVCPVCGFENTRQHVHVGFCINCDKFYEYEKIKKSVKDLCCIS